MTHVCLHIPQYKKSYCHGWWCGVGGGWNAIASLVDFLKNSTRLTIDMLNAAGNVDLLDSEKMRLIRVSVL